MLPETVADSYPCFALEIFMKKLVLMLGLVFVFALGLTSEAFARDDLARHFGVGVDSSLSTYGSDGHGISAVYFINKMFGLQLIFGLNMTTATVKSPDTTYDTTIVEYNISLRALIAAIRTKDVHLSFLAGFNFSGRAADGFDSSNEDYAKYNDGFQVSFDLGIRPEYFISTNFSIHTQVGIGINIITNDGSALSTGLSANAGRGDGVAYRSTNASGVNVDFFKNANLLTMAGCTFWF